MPGCPLTRFALTPSERELLLGMCNCYRVCGEGFEETVTMVANARGLERKEVVRRLIEMKERYGSDRDYRELRARLPKEFPI
jgi:hypothetical protein